MSVVRDTEAALARGDLLAAHDLAASAIQAGDASERLCFLRVLALARMGDTVPALALYDRYELETSDEVDSIALKGRLLKDAARAALPHERAALFAAASAAYERAARTPTDTFPLINAASTALLAGDRGAAERLARRVLLASSDTARYFAAATRAEALLVLGETAAAAEVIVQAAALPDADEGARSSTLRQIELLANALGLDESTLASLVAPLRAPPVIVYSGHMFRADAAIEASLASAIDAVLDRHAATVGYGALACGADILFAEALLRRGAELNVVLPFAIEAFACASVDPGGEGWRARFDACLAAARTLEYASQAVFVGDDHQFTYGSMMAMGLARARARHIGGTALQVVLWDGKVACEATVAGTAKDVDLWGRCGGRSEVIAAPALDRSLTGGAAVGEAPLDRAFRAIVFADFVGFSKLSEDLLPAFWRDVMGRAGAVLAANDARIEIANSWGDAVFAIVDDAVAGAEIALALRDATGATMRIGAHFGPVFLADDPVTGRRNAFGTEVTRAARVEPIVPAGEVYVTEQLAAMIMLASPDRFVTQYVGTVPLAKGYGQFRMFRLDRFMPSTLPKGTNTV